MIMAIRLTKPTQTLQTMMTMKTNHLFKNIIPLLLLAIFATSCEGYNEELIENLVTQRAFSPIGLTAKIRNQTTVELNWTTNETIDYYTVEFSADDPDFKTIYKTLKVSAKELPVKATLEGETTYSIRVKGISTLGYDDSKWSVTTATTLSEELFLPIVDAEIQAKQATLRWIANSNVTHITLNPGAIKRIITPEEKTTGVAIITGLTSETQYTAELFNNTKKRGKTTFKTGIDIGNGILIKPEDNLNEKITNAASGAILVLAPGDYNAFSGSITIDKPITIRGLYNFNKPKLHVNFLLAGGATTLTLFDLDLNGDKTLGEVIKYVTASTNYGDLTLTGCDIHDFTKALIYADVSVSKINSATIDNCRVTNILTSGADFIDFRKSHISKIDIKKSTFNNCAPTRDFIRIDAATGLSNTGLTSKVNIESCTLYNVCNTAGNRILYVRFLNNELSVRNTLIVQSLAVFSNQANTSTIAFSKNNYFNAPALFTTAIAPIQFDNSGTYSTQDPQFDNAALGKFKIKNQHLIDDQIGDPFWQK